MLSLPLIPDDSVAGPFTGGQNVAQDPLHIDLVLVSGANQYSAKPLALVRTTAPPIFALFSALPLEAGAAAVCVLPEGAEAEPPPELPQPAAISAAATTPAGTSHLLSIAVSVRLQVAHIPLTT